MGQADVLKVLEREKRWMSVSEIIMEKEINSKRELINRALKQMFKYNELFRKQVKLRGSIAYIYKSK
ncbi:hypothetical protein LCGC14_0731990 [marine sediment metagenome]|uniref:Uncharacterized protein n=1 Tax=marine sediment metagenome TaxID=412755 RepID=A0A0F9TGH2_9ZZZZ